MTPTASRQLARAPVKEQIDALDTLAKECRDLAFFQEAGQFTRALAIAEGIQRLRGALTPEVMTHVMALQGSALGFRTDKDKGGGYAVDVVKDCLIEATLRGAYPVNNEFNIISARSYLALNFFRRALREFPGLTDLRKNPGVPTTSQGGALVPYVVTAIYKGVARRWERTLKKLPDGSAEDGRIPVRVNEGMGADAILGKAERKMLAYVYADLTGSEHALVEGEVDEQGVIINAPPVGRVPLKVEPNGGIKQEPAPEPTPSPDNDLPPDQDDLAKQDKVNDLSFAIAQAGNVKDLENVGRDMNAAREWLGEERYAALMLTYQERYKALPKKDTKKTMF